MAVLAVAFFIRFASNWSRPAPTAAAAVPVDPAQMSFTALCDAYQSDRSDNKLLAEMYRRHEVPPEDWQHVITGQIYVGMTRTGLVCARGWPQQTRSTTTRYGVTDWYSYTSPRLLVRLENDKVESFSD